MNILYTIQSVTYDCLVNSKRTLNGKDRYAYYYYTHRFKETQYARVVSVYSAYATVHAWVCFIVVRHIICVHLYTHKSRIIDLFYCYNVVLWTNDLSITYRSIYVSRRYTSCSNVYAIVAPSATNIIWHM